MPIIIGGTGVGFSTNPLNQNEITLPPACAYMIPSGQYLAECGRYTNIQWLDPQSGIWRSRYPTPGAKAPVVSDGSNFRLINYTGCPAGAILTNKGSGYTSVPTVTADGTGGSLWKAIVGGALNTSVTVTTGGKYTYPPALIFPPPQTPGGMTATGIAVLSAGAINSITMVNRGSGYTSAPLPSQIQIVMDPRDVALGTAGGGVLTVNTTLADTQAVTGIYCIDPGTAPVTTIPALTFSGGGGSSAAATVIMNWTVTGATVNTAGVAYGTSLPFGVLGVSLLNNSSDFSGDVNPHNNLGIVTPRMPVLTGTSTSGGAVTATGLVIEDAGWGIQQVPKLLIIAGAGALPTTAGDLLAAVGGTNDTSTLQFLKL